MFFDFLEELATFDGYITDEQRMKCKNSGFLVENYKATKANQILECPKSGENKWEDSSLLEGGRIKSLLLDYKNTKKSGFNLTIQDTGTS